MSLKFIVGLFFIVGVGILGLAIESGSDQKQIVNNHLHEETLTPEEVANIYGNSTWILPDDWLESSNNSTTEEQSSDSKYLDPNTTEVKVTLEEAKAILTSENPELDSDSINGELINDSDFGIIWQLKSKTSNDRTIRVCIDPDDGNILYIYDGSKKIRADDKVTEEEAVSISKKYIETKLSEKQLKEVHLVDIPYTEPVA
ncbi:MAG: hypothetical protein PWQ44_2093 [Methanolobus sp.]|jgi:hypothetical protein|nr:hypothetical protein [Methanolobus sp.]